MATQAFLLLGWILQYHNHSSGPKRKSRSQHGLIPNWISYSNQGAVRVTFPLWLDPRKYPVPEFKA